MAIRFTHELDAISAIHVQLALLTKKLDTTNVSASQTQNFSYDSCGVGQSSNDGQVGNFSFPQNEQANYVNNYQRNNNLYDQSLILHIYCHILIFII